MPLGYFFMANWKKNNVTNRPLSMNARPGYSLTVCDDVPPNPGRVGRLRLSFDSSEKS